MNEKTPIGLELDVINQSITNIAQAKNLIIDGARERVSRFGWPKFNVIHPEIYFDRLFPQVIDKLPQEEIKTQSIKTDRENLIYQTLDTHKTALDNQRFLWLVMLNREIPPKIATHLRNSLWLQVTVDIARESDTIIEVIRSFRENSDPNVRYAILSVSAKNKSIASLYLPDKLKNIFQH